MGAVWREAKGEEAMTNPIVWTAVPVPYALLVRLRERGDPAAAIVRILKQVLGQERVVLPDAAHDG